LVDSVESMVMHGLENSRRRLFPRVIYYRQNSVESNCLACAYLTVTMPLLI